MITRTTFTELTKRKIKERIAQMIDANWPEKTLLEETRQIILEEYGKKSLVCALETKLETIQNDAFKIAREMVTDVSYLKRERQNTQASKVSQETENYVNNQTTEDNVIDAETTDSQEKKLDTEKKAILDVTIRKIQYQAAKLEVIEFLWTKDNKNQPSLKKEMAYNLLSTARKKLFSDSESCINTEKNTVEIEIESLQRTIETTNEFLLQLNNNTSPENLQELLSSIIAELTTLNSQIKESGATPEGNPF